MSKSTVFKPLSVVVAAGIAIVGCSAEDLATSDDNGDDNDVVEPMETLIRVEAAGVIDGLAPYANNASASNVAMAPIYEGLVERNAETSEIEPLLAHSWEIVDEHTWVFELEENVTFHDGTDFNADAVVYSFDQVVNNPNASRSSILDPIDEITVVDEFTVEITTHEPFGPMLDLLSRPQMRIISPEADENTDLNAHGVGTGTHEFVEWSQGDRLELKAYEDYWGSPPLVDTFITREVSDHNTALSLVETGEAHFVGAVPEQQAGRVEAMDGVDLVTSDGTGVRYLGMNTEREPMDDIEFRRAVSMAIDRDAYIEHIGGFGQRTDSYAGSNTFGYDEAADDQGVAYDPDGARDIIEDNDWEGTEIELVASNAENSVDIATLVQAALEDVGLNVDIQLYDGPTAIERARSGEHDISINGFTSAGNSMLADTLHSRSIGDGSNMAQFSNEELDELLDQADATVDEAEREAILREANLFAMEQMPWVVMRHDMNIIALADEAAEVITVTATGSPRILKEDEVVED